MEESPSSLNVSALLRARAESLRRDAMLLAGRIERVSLARLVTAALIVIAIGGAIAEPQRRAAFLLAVVLTIAGFVALPCTCIGRGRASEPTTVCTASSRRHSRGPHRVVCLWLCHA